MKYSKWKEDYFTAAMLLILLPARVFTNIIAKKGRSLLEFKGLSLCTRKRSVFHTSLIIIKLSSLLSA